GSPPRSPAPRVSQPNSRPAAPAGPHSASKTTLPAPSQAPAVAADTTRADTLHITAPGGGRYVHENGEWVGYFQNNVHLVSDSTTVDSRTARAYRERGIAYFYGNVVVHDRGVVATGDEGEFSRPGNYAELRGHVTIKDQRGTMHSKRARYWRDTQNA